MFRLRLPITTLLVVLPSLGEVAGAQARCGYAECALRVDRKRIVQGQSGEVLVRLGPYTGVANRVNWLSDSARVHAERYGVRRSTAASLRLLAWGMSIGSAVLGYHVYDRYHEQADRIRAQQEAGGPVTERLELDKSKLALGSALSIGAFAAGWIAGRVNEDARTELARAVWWHNRQLR
jgi:hypothetical protein